jgi:class 3 adenylate cyclase
MKKRKAARGSSKRVRGAQRRKAATLDLTARVKYVFLDIVGYSNARSAEAQAEIISQLNLIVRHSTANLLHRRDSYLFLPTGDGMCVAILDISTEYDIHLKLALNILKEIQTYNESCSDEMRKFEVRIGLNENVDNRIVDINGNNNIAGAGINSAQRVMSTADASQIMVGETVFETLRHRELYMNSFVRFEAVIKHGVRMPVY